jgi:hypothetical protein
VATFLGRKLSENYQGELGNDFNTRIEGGVSLILTIKQLASQNGSVV